MGEETRESSVSYFTMPTFLSVVLNQDIGMEEPEQKELEKQLATGAVKLAKLLEENEKH